MQFITNIFWNRDEKRLRSLWRVFIQGGTWFFLLLIVQTVIGIVAALAYIAAGVYSPEDLLNQATVNQILFAPGILLVVAFGDLAIVFLTTWFFGRFLDKRRFVDFGFHFNRDWWIDFGFGLFLGAFSLTLIFLIEWAAGWVTITGAFVTLNPSIPFPLAILFPLLLFVIVGIEEELFSRGYQLTNLAEGTNLKGVGPRWAIVIATIISSIIFGWLHAGNPNATTASTVYLMVAGVSLAVGYILTGELAIPIGYHIAWNFFEGNVFGFPVSGGDYRSATFIAIEQGGPGLWTGGVFGPEAGLVGLGVTVLGMALIWLWVWLRYRRTGLFVAIAAPPPRSGETLTEAIDELQE